MLIGVNWIAPHTLPAIRALIDQGSADFCEIMVDNFIHLPAKEIKMALPDVPIALHIVASRFLEKPLDEIESLAIHLRRLIHDLQPIYVSDHLIQFTDEAGRRLPMIAEWDYDQHYSHIKNRVLLWQELLGANVLFENHASITSRGKNQAEFYEKLIHDTHASLLFDFSNAHIAELNQICQATSWDAHIRQTAHFHVAGFKLDSTSGLALDTHDEPIADAVLTSMQTYFAQDEHKENRTIVLECDANVDLATWENEIVRLRSIL